MRKIPTLKTRVTSVKLLSEVLSSNWLWVYIQGALWRKQATLQKASQNAMTAKIAKISTEMTKRHSLYND